ncbi:diacylglycerol kinase family protein [Micropruina sonneratiae]|uniref:diacylglycerol kinase family protein n=1 Tax=Micropruina sonneratiae TaxID=2986940 RepID=UPI002226D94A|nr:diacylglycerol kinase family protein [Micropruina sp. KQZ13P-5]MCW3159147.1 diacylglycerol kinase family protein [Micropruina sp. KQZ13P-5]
MGFGVWTALLYGGALTGLDAVVAPLPHWQNPVVQVAAALAIVFHPFVLYAGLLGVAVWAYRRRLRNLTVGVVLAVGLGWGGYELVKFLVQRPRPTDTLSDLITSSGWSYPSGHMVATITAALVVVSVTTTTRQPRGVIEFLRYLGVALVLLVALDRWLLHAHFLSDIVGGFMLGGFTASLALTITRVHMQPARPTKAAAAASDKPKRCAIVVNPTKIPDWAAFRRHVEFACSESGWTPMFLETSVDDPGRSMTRSAVEAGVDLVMVAGGDGTVRVVCSELSGTGVPVGLLPSGTGNLLARNLGVPLDESEALDVVLHGRVDSIDLVELTIDDADHPEHIAVMAGMGLDARIMSGTDDGLKKIIGPAAYVVAAGDAANLPSFDVTVSLDGAEPMERHAGLVMVGNVGSLQGNLQLLPDARFDDGKLDLFVASPASVADWLRITTSVLLPGKEASEIDRGQGSEVLIETSEPVEYQLDGDAAGECRKLHARIVPKTLNVMVPEKR